MQRQGHNDIGDEGWATTRQAARVLNVIPRQVRNYIAAGHLEGRKEGRGVNERWLVSISSVETLRQKRHSEGKHSVQDRDVATEAEDTGRSAEGNLALIRELAKRLEDVQYELGRTEARLELLAQAESTLQEALERERERAARLEVELREVRKLQPTEPRDISNTASETVADRDADLSRESQQGKQQRLGLYRFFFGPS